MSSGLKGWSAGSVYFAGYGVCQKVDPLRDNQLYPQCPDPWGAGAVLTGLVAGVADGRVAPVARPQSMEVPQPPLAARARS